MDWTKMLKRTDYQDIDLDFTALAGNPERGINPDDVYGELEDKILDVMVEVANDNFDVGASTDSFFPMTTNAGLKKLFESIMIYVEGEEKGD